MVSGPGSNSLTTGQYTTFSIRFLPTAGGAASGTVTFANNDLNEGTFDFTVTGTGLTPSCWAKRGTKDWAGNGAADSNDPGIAGRQVFLDLNGNGVYDTSPSATAFDSGTVNVAIPDATGAVGVSSQTVTGIAGRVVTKVTVRANITHTWDSDLALELVGPNGQSVILATGVGGSGDNFTNTVFDDSGSTAVASGTAPFTGTFRPMEALAEFIGSAAAGTWKLRARDSAGGDTGTIVDWTLNLTIAEPTQTTAASGTYAFAGMPAGTATRYASVITVPVRVDGTRSGGRRFVFADTFGRRFGQRTRFRLGPAKRTLYGQMINDLDGDGVRDAGRTPRCPAGGGVFDDRG